jgi:phage terminase Nu1 subunit (DNA packaging protein)
MTQIELANLSGFSVQRVGQLIKSRILPKPGADGEFTNRDKTITALFKHCRALQPTGAKQRLEMAQARLAELKLKRARREVVLLDRVMADWADVTLRFRQTILQIPGRIGSQTGDSAAAKIAEMIVGDALRELSREILASADQPHAAWELPDEETPAEK